MLLDVVGDGVTLTGAGYLKPTAVEQIAHRTGITEWWIGKANREDLTWPVAESAPRREHWGSWLWQRPHRSDSGHRQTQR